MAEQSLILRAEWRASISVRLSLHIWPQGDAPSVVGFLVFHYNHVLQHHPGVVRGTVSHYIPG